jgi:hypothetical protein
MTTTSQSIETFDALLRDLLTWGLVEPVVTDNAAQRTVWQLTGAAQRRLTELAAPLGPCPAHKIVFLDHFCADCQERRLTRLHDGVYLCDDCAAARLEAGADEDPDKAVPVNAVDEDGAVAERPPVSEGPAMAEERPTREAPPVPASPQPVSASAGSPALPSGVVASSDRPS